MERFTGGGGVQKAISSLLLSLFIVDALISVCCSSCEVLVISTVNLIILSLLVISIATYLTQVT